MGRVGSSNVAIPSFDSSVAELRAFLTGGRDTYRRPHGTRNSDAPGAFAVLLTAACSKAVENRFGKQPAVEDIIAFVSDARARTIGADTVPAEDAEKVLRVTPGHEVLLTRMDTRARAGAQTAMLFALTHENEDSQNQVEDLLAHAVEVTTTYLRNRAAR
jgi:hypothetical protein